MFIYNVKFLNIYLNLFKVSKLIIILKLKTFYKINTK
jgi:hypothetical protein